VKYKAKVDVPTINGILYKGTTLITEEDVSSKDKVRCKDGTGKIWYLSYHQIESLTGE
jgi:hypothetical protein|tara:strand:+ start:202 stop:375 length:174 start_codon:yes stop_codon:yes gene_type:complete